jgi:drug/metabolite transporter (DMT)-like permease
MPRRTLQYLELHFVVFLFGFTAILGKLVQLPVYHLIWYRTVLASVGLAVVLLLQARRKLPASGLIIKLLATGFVVALHWYFFFEAARISNVAVSLVGIATAPLWVAVLQPILYKTKLSILQVAMGLVVMLGLYVIFLVEVRHGLGLLYSVFSGLLAAIFTMINSRFVQKLGAMAISFYEMCGATLAMSIYMYIAQIKPIVPHSTDWLWLLLLGIVCSVYAFSAVVRLLQHLSTYAVNLVINLEPVYGILLAYFIFGDAEKMTSGFYIGTFIILLAVFGYQISSRWEKPI